MNKLKEVLLKLFSTVKGALSWVWSLLLSGIFGIAILYVGWLVINKMIEYYHLFHVWSHANEYVKSVPSGFVLLAILAVAGLAFVGIKKLTKFLSTYKLHGAREILRYDRPGDKRSGSLYLAVGKCTNLLTGVTYLNCVQIYHFVPPNGIEWTVREDAEGELFEYTSRTFIDFVQSVGLCWVQKYQIGQKDKLSETKQLSGKR